MSAPLVTLLAAAGVVLVALGAAGLTVALLVRTAALLARCASRTAAGVRVRRALAAWEARGEFRELEPLAALLDGGDAPGGRHDG